MNADQEGLTVYTKGDRLAAVCVGLAFLIVACGNNLRESSYRTLADARNDGAIDRGWLPDYLRQSSREIHEIHRIEHPKTWCSFKFLANDSESLRRTLKSLDKSQLAGMRIEDPSVSWWPAEFDGNLQVGKVNQEGYELLGVDESTGGNRTLVYLFLIDWSKGRAFFYQTTRRNAGQR